MTGIQQENRTIRYCALAIATGMMFEAGGALPLRLSGQEKTSGAISSSRRMADGKRWTTRNLDVRTAGSYCYEDSERSCREYGRLYTWDAARRGCQALGDGWRLPTNDEWRQMAKHYGGVREDAVDGGKEAYKMLLIGGDSGFGVVFGGNRSEDGGYARLEAHGFYWTASESDAANAWLYNFGKGAQILNRHSDGNKKMAISVRCVRD